MRNQKWHNIIKDQIRWLQGFAGRVWYPPFIGVLAALDNLILFIPNDGILISSSLLIPKRWFVFALNVTVGSTLGALALAALVQMQGLPWILDIYPGIDSTKIWLWTADVFKEHGILLVFLIGLTPFTQQPIIILAGLANSPLLQLAVMIFFSRLIKYLFMSYVGSHAPRLLNKFWGLREELEDVGIK